MTFYIAIAIIWLAIYVIDKYLTAERQRKAAEEAEKERLWRDFLAPWQMRLELLKSSSGARDLQSEVKATDAKTEWKNRLLAQLKFKLDAFIRQEALDEFRKQSKVASSFPLSSMFLYELPRSAGIYRIFNVANNRSYIGESRNIQRRLESHLDILSKGKHKTRKSPEDRPQIQDEYLEFGPDLFGVQVLRVFSIDNVKQRHASEAEFIAKFDGVGNGYNHRYNESWNRKIVDQALKELIDGTIAADRIDSLLEACKEFKLNKTQDRAIAKYRAERMENRTYNTGTVFWTKEKILESALQFRTRNEFKLNHPKAYDAARRHNVLDDVCSHMAPPANQNARAKKGA